MNVMFEISLVEISCLSGSFYRIVDPSQNINVTARSAEMEHEA